jgi:hypothetical protein
MEELEESERGQSYPVDAIGCRDREAQESSILLGKAHSGILHNEIADTLATRLVSGSTYCPTTQYEEIPTDSDKEDDPEMNGVIPLIRQDDEWDDEIHFPTFSTAVASQDQEEETSQEQRDRQFQHFSPNILGSPSAEVTYDDSYLAKPDPDSTVVVLRGGMRIVDPGELEPPADPIKTWSSQTWKQAKEDAARETAQ